MRQRLREDNVREIQAAFDEARTLDEGQKNCEVHCLSTNSNSFHSSDSAAVYNPGEENSSPSECLSMQIK